MPAYMREHRKAMREITRQVKRGAPPPAGRTCWHYFDGASEYRWATVGGRVKRYERGPDGQDWGTRDLGATVAP